MKSVGPGGRITNKLGISFRINNMTSGLAELTDKDCDKG